MGRTPTLTYDRGTLILHPPPRGKRWIDFARWDDRIEKFRIPARQYRALVEALKTEGTAFNDKTQTFQPLELSAKAGDGALSPPAGGAAGLAGTSPPRGDCAADGVGEDLSGPNGDAGDSSPYPGDGSHSGPHAPVVCPSGSGFSRCGSGAAGRRFQGSVPDSGGDLR